MPSVYALQVTAGDFLLRVRGARDARMYRFRGEVATELHRLRDSGQLERPGGTARLNDLIRDRQPDSVAAGGINRAEDAHFDVVADDELRGYLSQRLLERRGAAEGGGLLGAPGGGSVEPSDAPSQP